jgi:hypothetical protein
VLAAGAATTIRKRKVLRASEISRVPVYFVTVTELEGGQREFEYRCDRRGELRRLAIGGPRGLTGSSARSCFDPETHPPAHPRRGRYEGSAETTEPSLVILR